MIRKTNEAFSIGTMLAELADVQGRISGTKAEGRLEKSGGRIRLVHPLRLPENLERRWFEVGAVNIATQMLVIVSKAKDLAHLWFFGSVAFGGTPAPSVDSDGQVDPRVKPVAAELWEKTFVYPISHSGDEVELRSEICNGGKHGAVVSGAVPRDAEGILRKWWKWRSIYSLGLCAETSPGAATFMIQVRLALGGTKKVVSIKHG